jgi:hypothetical protein
MVNAAWRYDASESMAALVMASRASPRLADTERSTAGAQSDSMGEGGKKKKKEKERERAQRDSKEKAWRE